jgi:hypothetical protein
MNVQYLEYRLFLFIFLLNKFSLILLSFLHKCSNFDCHWSNSWIPSISSKLISCSILSMNSSWSQSYFSMIWNCLSNDGKKEIRLSDEAIKDEENLLIVVYFSRLRNKFSFSSSVDCFYSCTWNWIWWFEKWIKKKKSYLNPSISCVLQKVKIFSELLIIHISVFPPIFFTLAPWDIKRFVCFGKHVTQTAI